MPHFQQARPDVRVPDHGAFVCSLDFELRWGLREKVPPNGGGYRENLRGVRSAVPKILEVFRDRGVHATWATVGFLMARSREECLASAPSLRPQYRDPSLCPYGELETRIDLEAEMHFASELVDLVAATPGQEIGTHTFSHYYCLENGQTYETFVADLQCAVRTAKARGLELRAIVFPRNQANERYHAALTDVGIVAFRGNQPGWPHRAVTDRESRSSLRRGARLLDAYAPLSGRTHLAWRDIPVSERLCDVRASAFLRPWSPTLRRLDRVRLARLRRAIRQAAEERAVFHLWWHPHNFGTHLQENTRFLEDVLDEVEACSKRFGMRSMSMGEVASALGC